MHVQSKSQQNFLRDIDKVILKFTVKGTRTRIAITILKKVNKFGGLTLHNFRTYKFLVIKALVKGQMHINQ